MTIESILHFLEQKDEMKEAISAENEVNMDWAAGYKHALLQLREFICSDAGAHAGAEVSTTVDFLNDAPFLEAMHRAINLCAVAEAVLSRLPKDDADALSSAASHFRNWFAADGA